MSLDSYTTQGSNRAFAAGILGAFWTQTMPDNGLVPSVISEAALKAGVSERFLRDFPGWLTATVDGVMRLDRLEVVPVDSASREPASLGDGYVVGGAVLGAPSQSCRWRVKLSETYKEIPLILPSGGGPLLNGIDYEVDGAFLVLRENPAALGIPYSMEDVNGIPTACWLFFLPSCIPGGEGVTSNFDFYNAPVSARRALLDMLTQEGSLVRVLRYLEACVGISSPTVYDKTDDNGQYTSLESTWVENGAIHGVTSGGEIVSVPKDATLVAGYNTEDNRIAPGTPVSGELQAFTRYSDSPGAGLPAGDAFLPNTETSLTEGETGAIDPSGTFDSRLATAAETAGLDVSEELPEGVANPVERVYGLLGRPQPQAVSVRGVALERLSAVPSVMSAVSDSMPAGTLLVIGQEAAVTDEATLSAGDACDVFIVKEFADHAALEVSDMVAVPRGVALS